MKLKLEVVNTTPEGSVFLKPLYSGLHGLLEYRGLPARARERFLIGFVVDAEVPLPDFYPVNEPENRQEYGYAPEADLKERAKYSTFSAIHLASLELFIESRRIDSLKACKQTITSGELDEILKRTEQATCELRRIR